MKSIQKKNNTASIGIPATIILISGILVAVTAASVIIGGTTDSSNLDIDDISKLVDETTDEISTYIQIKDIMGKFNKTQDKPTIQQIAILIKPMFSTDIDLSNLMIKLNNGDEIKILNHNKLTETIKSYSLFKHPIWTNTSYGEYSAIITHDKDQSILNYNTINSNTDMSYITIPLSDDFSMKKGDTMTISLIPTPGTMKTITIEAPMPINNVVSLL